MRLIVAELMLALAAAKTIIDVNIAAGDAAQKLEALGPETGQVAS